MLLSVDVEVIGAKVEVVVSGVVVDVVDAIKVDRVVAARVVSTASVLDTWSITWSGAGTSKRSFKSLKSTADIFWPSVMLAACLHVGRNREND